MTQAAQEDTVETSPSRFEEFVFRPVVILIRPVGGMSSFGAGPYLFEAGLSIAIGCHPRGTLVVVDLLLLFQCPDDVLLDVLCGAK